MWVREQVDANHCHGLPYVNKYLDERYSMHARRSTEGRGMVVAQQNLFRRGKLTDGHQYEAGRTEDITWS